MKTTIQEIQALAVELKGQMNLGVILTVAVGAVKARATTLQTKDRRVARDKCRDQRHCGFM